ncbi:hypothetical protein [Roseiconus lacunae]|uniref:Uncharacterized protein n=1 Tax=Roseiconus lacunae TaxID=2605694 RepID=A0ABT7PGG7_9BACT|nr:hypothetical protein [Roseiconus lacunae]MDM4015579.1 hypothetical protein [Roseiconus lacunae]
MLHRLAIGLLLASACSGLFAEQPPAKPEYRIIVTGKNTLLFNRMTGETWALNESDAPAWEPILRKATASDDPSDSGDKDVIKTKLDDVLELHVGKPTESEKTILVRIVAHRSMQLQNGYEIFVKPSNDIEIIMATKEAISLRTSELTWLVEPLAEGQTKTIEFQLGRLKDSAKDNLEFVWGYRSEGGASGQTTTSIKIAK